MSIKSRGIGIVAMVAAVAVAIAAVAGGWWYVKSQRDTITVTAQFESVAGMYVDNKVSVLGMPVGKVTKITSHGTYMEVEFTVSRKVKVPADAQAVMVSNSILTDRHIELTPVYKQGAVLQNGDTIGLTRTKVPVEFDKVLAMIDRLTKALRGDGKGGGPLASLVNTSAEIATGSGPQMKSALDQLSQALRLSSDGGAVTRGQLTTIIKNVSSLFDAAAGNDATIRRFGSTIHQLSVILDDEKLGTGETGKRLNDILLQASSLLETNRDAIKRVIGNANTSTQSLNDYKREVAEGFDLLPLVMDNVYNIIDPVNHVARTHVLADKLLFDSQASKEICNMLGLRQLGCSTGTLQDYGPDFGLTYVLDGLAQMGQK